MALPTTGSLNTLRKRAGKSRAIITKTNTASPSLIPPGFLSQGDFVQKREKRQQGYNFKSAERTAPNLQKLSGKANFNRSSQNIRRSLRLVEKSKKSNEDCFRSKFFSQSDPPNNNIPFCQRFDGFEPRLNEISTYLSQPLSNTGYVNCNSSFKLDVGSENKQTNTALKIKESNEFKLFPQESNLNPCDSSFDSTPRDSPDQISRKVSRSFEAALCDHIKVEWATDIHTQFSRTLTKAFDKINRILSGEIMADNKENEDYARPYQTYLREGKSQNVVLDQKIYNTNTAAAAASAQRPASGAARPDVGRQPQTAADGPVVAWNGTYPVPRGRWVYRTPERQRHQRPRLDERTGLRCGLVRRSGGRNKGGAGAGAGAVSVYRVHRRFEGRCFVGDAAHVPLSGRYFSHVGDFGEDGAAADGKSAEGGEVRYLKVKTSTAAQQGPEQEGGQPQMDCGDGGLDIDSFDLDLSSREVDEEYDPFLIGRPTKAKATISRKELFELKRPLDEMEMDDPSRDLDYLPKKRLFIRNAALGEEFDECIIMN